MHFPGNRPTLFQKFIAEHEPALRTKNIWVTSPKYLVFSNLRAGELMYDPTVNTEEISALRKKLPQADYIFLDSLDLPCNPPADEECRQARRELIAEIEQNFVKEFYANNPGLEITIGIFRRK